MPINVVFEGGAELFVDGKSLHHRAICITSNLEWTWTGMTLSGSNKKIPIVTGQKPRRRRYDQTENTLDLVVVGEVSRATGLDLAVPSLANLKIGFQENLEWLEANVTGLPGTADSTRPVSVALDDGTTRSGVAQFGPIVIGQKGKGTDQNGRPTYGAVCTIPITLPHGPLT